MKNPVVRLQVIFVLFFLCLCVFVHAADIEFEVNTGASYDSNVYRSATDSEEDDAYFMLAPKLALKVPLNKSYFASSLRAAIEQHVNVTDANLQELVFSGLGRYNPSDYISFGLRDELVVSERLQSVEKLADVTNYREFVDNRFYSGFKYELKGGVLVSSLEYANTIRNYRDTEKDDWIAHAGKLSSEYFFGHRTSTQLEISLIRKTYQLDVDYISIPVTASLKRKLSSKLDATLSLGSESRRYNDINDIRNWDKPTMSFEIVGTFTPKTSSRLLVRRKSYDSDIAVGYAFMSASGDAALSFVLTDAAQLILQGLYSRNGYVQIDRTDNVYGGRVAVQYGLSRWGAIVLGYGHERRTSDVLNRDYIQNTVDLSYVALF